MAGHLVSLQEGFLVAEEHNGVSDTPSWARRAKHAWIRTLFLYMYLDIRIRMLCIILLPISTIPKQRMNDFKIIMWDWKGSQRGELAEVRKTPACCRSRRAACLPQSTPWTQAMATRRRPADRMRRALTPHPSHLCRKTRRDPSGPGSPTSPLRIGSWPLGGCRGAARGGGMGSAGIRWDEMGTGGNRHRTESKTPRPSQKGGLKFSEPFVLTRQEKHCAACVVWFRSSPLQRVFSEQLFFSPRGSNATEYFALDHSTQLSFSLGGWRNT